MWILWCKFSTSLSTDELYALNLMGISFNKWTTSVILYYLGSNNLIIVLFFLKKLKHTLIFFSNWNRLVALEEDEMMWKILFIIFYHVHLADNIYIYIHVTKILYIVSKKICIFFQH